MEVLVEKTGEGVQFQEQELPIDISYSKLAEWLVDRKKVPADWRKRLAPVHARIAKELHSLPRDADPWLLPLSSENTAYLEARRVRDTLAARSPEARTLFGGLSGTAGSWDAIVRAYEKDSLFLGEASQILVQHTNYEIPFLKKQVGKLQQQLADLDRREAETKRGAAASAHKFQQACQDLGIAGRDIKRELRGLVKRLPSVFRTVVESLCSEPVGQALDYYQAFVQYAHVEQGAEAPGVLPTLTQLRADPPDPATMAVSEPPLTTSSPSATGRTPGVASSEAPSVNWDLDSAAASGNATEVSLPANGISWDVGPVGEGERAGGGDPGEKGDEQPTISWDIGALDSADQTAESTPPQISWDLDPSDLQPSDEPDSANETAAPQISWDLDASDLQPTDLSDPTAGSAPVEINWDFEITAGEEGEAAAAPQINWDVDLEASEVEGSGAESSSAAGTAEEGASGTPGKAAAGNPLAQTEYRNRLLDDLYELHAFLQQRRAELDRGDSAAVQSQLLAGAPLEVQQHGADSLAPLDAAVGAAVETLTSRQTRDLLLLLSSPRFLERLAVSLEQKKGQEVKLQESMQEIQVKRLELRSSLSATWPKQDGAIKRTKEVKKFVEDTLSKQYNGRPVNIIGEINTLLGA